MGLVAKHIKSPSDRAEFRKSDTYAKLNALVEQKMKQTGMVAGAEPRVCRNRSHNRGSGTADAS